MLPRTLARLAAAHPGMAVRLSEQRSGPQLAALEAGALEVALAYGAPGSPALRSRALLTVPVVAIVRADHHLARRAALTFADLDREPCGCSAASSARRCTTRCSAGRGGPGWR